MLRTTIVAAILLAPVYAFADNGDKIDIGPLVKDLWPIIELMIVTIVIPAVGLIARKANRYLNLENDRELRRVLNSAISRGLALAQSRVEEAADAGNLSVKTKNELTFRALAYVVEHENEAMKLLGYDRDSLKDKIHAELELNTVPPEKSVAVPTPSPAPVAQVAVSVTPPASGT